VHLNMVTDETRKPMLSTQLGQKISVCLLAYNHAEVIESTLKSILDQTIEGYEIVVSDDCSTDGTWERLQSLAAEDTRIRLVRTPRNLGMPGNANHAVAQTDRPYIALLHHDDIYREDLLEKWAGVLERHADVAFVFNAYGIYQSDCVHQVDMPSECVDGRWLLNKYLLPRWGCAVRGTGMIRRSSWELVGGMREQFGLLSDVDLWMRLSMRWHVGHVPEPVIVVRHHRCENYPDEYKDSGWSWRRQQFLYEIHAAIRKAHWNLQTPVGRFKWWRFRLKVSIETTKWLMYAVVRNKPAMVTTSHDSVTDCDLLPLRLLRRGLQKVYSKSGRKDRR
jgi:glycosyltransferase involved in cell wall biosynthesis